MKQLQRDARYSSWNLYKINFKIKRMFLSNITWNFLIIRIILIMDNILNAMIVLYFNGLIKIAKILLETHVLILKHIIFHSILKVLNLIKLRYILLDWLSHLMLIWTLLLHRLMSDEHINWLSLLINWILHLVTFYI
jgi:hypothetical protein